MKTEYEIANIIFDECRKANLSCNGIMNWMSINEHLHEVLNPKEQKIATLVLEKLCKKKYIGLEAESGVFPHWLRLLERGFDYIYNEAAELDSLDRIQIVPDEIDIFSDEAFNEMWKWIGDNNSPKYLTGPQLYKIMLEIKKDLPPTYTFFINKRRKNGESTTRIDWVYEFWESLPKDLKKSFLNIIENRVNHVEPVQKMDSSIRDNKDTSTDNPWESSTSTSTTIVKDDMQHNKVGHQPSVFISYSWDSDDHQKWVKHLAEELKKRGITVYLDQDLGLGGNIQHFIENSIEEADRILVIGTPPYKKKALGLKKGVGFEYSIISVNMMNNMDTKRFVPILRDGMFEESFPPLLQKHKGVLMNDDNKFAEMIEVLARGLYNTKDD